MKRKLPLICILTTILLISACSLSKSSKNNNDVNEDNENENNEVNFGDYNVQLSGEFIEEDDTFIIEGESNLLPDTVLTGEVVVDDGETVFSEEEAFVEEDGSFQMALEHHIYGDADLIVRFDFEDRNKQDEEIVEHYGEDGEDLKGPFVTRQQPGDKKKAEAKIHYTAEEENDLVIQTPEWKERPEDYGDGHVWFEDVEVEEDGRYFYVSGQTNLLEGTDLQMMVPESNGRTKVQKDGTFEATFEYRYHEDNESEMAIEFEPAKGSNHWDRVLEHYGEDGKELEGDLVENSSLGSGNKKIVYPIDWDEDESNHIQEEENEVVSNNTDIEDLEQGDYEVYLTGEMIEEDDKIIIEGESNLLPGSNVIGEVVISSNTGSLLSDFTEYEYQADATETIEEDGSFTMKIDHHNEEDTETFVSVRFDLFEDQEDEILRHYGEHGENMKGRYIYKAHDEGPRVPSNIYNRAEIMTDFVTGDDNIIRQFTEPVLKETPDDMGDPEVWIEVDEINDDGEYYYIQGKSNLIEGSMLEVLSDSGKPDAATLVNQDGTFDFKFPYEEKKDPFKIRFKPYEFQWNVIEKTYGSKGEKLEGNLIEEHSANKEESHAILELEDDSKEIEVPDNVELDIDGSEAKMLVPDDVLFDYDESDLKKDAKKTLDDIAEVLDESFNKKDLDIEIAGHTDNEGSTSYNMDLSEDRADAVKDYLEDQINNDDMTFDTKGYADKEPVASNDTEKGQAKNRRVEVTVKLK